MFLLLLTRSPCRAATVSFTYVPPYGSSQDLQGQVAGVDPAGHKVAVYIYVSGWWTKPYFGSPLTSIQGDGVWTCDITTGGDDQNATRIAAYLLENGYTPPTMSGGGTLPAELNQNALAHTYVEREPPYRTLSFSGYTWKVKASESRVGPGPNYFSDNTADVWVDGSDRLHLNIVYRSGKWYSTEVFTTETLGYGTYTFILGSRVDQLDRKIVLGLFTWDDDAPQHNYREIDIELSRWGEETGKNAQYVVQPWDTSGNRHRFDMALQGNYSTHLFDWQADGVLFSSFQGSTLPPDPGDEIESLQYTGGDTPPAGGEGTRINLWLIDGAPPSDVLEEEVIVESFKYDPGAIRINYQPGTAGVPAGYRADDGSFLFEGINFGWK